MMYRAAIYTKIIFAVLVGFFLLHLFYRWRRRRKKQSYSIKKEPVIIVNCRTEGKVRDENRHMDRESVANLKIDLSEAVCAYGRKEKCDLKLAKKEVDDLSFLNNSDISPDLIALTIMAKSGERYSGYELLQALLAVGFRYGAMNIFHRHENTDGTGDILFSLAQAVLPGSFDLSDAGTINCPGFAVFMEIKKTSEDLKTLAMMIDTAKELVEDLGGNIYDEDRKPLTQKSIDRWREKIIVNCQ